jgi:hypothetical protein
MSAANVGYRPEGRDDRVTSLGAELLLVAESRVDNF